MVKYIKNNEEPKGSEEQAMGSCEYNKISSLYFSLVDVDLFGDLIPSTTENGIQNKDIFDIASLGDSLPDSKKDNKTPETFLGPNASSLVNLDSLVTVPQSVKSRNPFLAGRLHRQEQQHGIVYRNPINSCLQ